MKNTPAKSTSAPALNVLKRTPNGLITSAAASGGVDVVQLILRDHVPLKELIELFKDADKGRKEKAQALEEFVFLLMGHAKAEELTLYAKMKEKADLRMQSYEGDTEHTIADQLIQEINRTPGDDEWAAKVKVLAELVEHHILEEENGMLDDVAESLTDAERIKLGADYAAFSEQYRSLNAVRTPRDGRIVERNLN